jgi:Ribbon-helix-helix protein, copG family
MNNLDEATNENENGAIAGEPQLVTEEGYVLKPRPRPSEEVSLRVPLEALASIDRIAAARDMSREALMKFYIGQGLRRDLAHLYGERVLEKTAEILNKHIPSEEAVSAILHEIRTEAAA